MKKLSESQIVSSLFVVLALIQGLFFLVNYGPMSIPDAGMHAGGGTS